MSENGNNNCYYSGESDYITPCLIKTDTFTGDASELLSVSSYYLGEFVKSEIVKWAAPIKASGVQVN